MTEAMAISQGTVIIPSTTKSKVIPPNTNTSTILSNTQNEPFIMSVASQNPPVTPGPLVDGVSRTYALGFTILTSDPIYGMPTTSMTGLQNNNSTYTRPLTSAFSPLQGSGSGVNHMARNYSQPGYVAQLPPITTNTQVVLRQ